MVENGGFIPLGAQKTKFKFKDGVHPLGTSSRQAGARVTMSWNQAMLAQAQGWGHMEIGRRPHDARPHLLGTRPPAGRKEEAKENKHHVQAAHQTTSRVPQISPSSVRSLDFPLLPRHHTSTSAVGVGRTRDALAEMLDFWSSLQRDLEDVWRKHSWMQLTPGAMFAGELGRWGSANGKPHGLGCLALAEAQHLGSFREGRAEGQGLWFSSCGKVCFGKWKSNARVGDFILLDGQGRLWREQYDSQGKRYSKKMAPVESEPGEAFQCSHCNWKYHQRFNHCYACQLGADGADGCAPHR